MNIKHRNAGATAATSTVTHGNGHQ